MTEHILDHHILGDLQYFCMFIGYPYSGHSLVGSIIDAHPNAVISHELHIGKLLKRGLTKEKIFPMIVLNSARFAREGRTWNNYSYAIPGEWNGKYRTIRVIGDKKGGGSTKFFTKKADIFDQVDTSFGIPVKYIHVMRNPYDLISTLFLKRRFDGPGKLRHLIDSCFLHIEHVEALRSQIEETNWFDMYHEILLSDPDTTISRLFHFLELDIETGFIENCKKILFTSPHKSRLNIEWPNEEIDYVAARLMNSKRFASYTFQT